MKFLAAISLLFLSLTINAQTGDFIYNFDLEYRTDSPYYSVALLDKGDTIYFKEHTSTDTIRNLRPKTYRLTFFYAPDSAIYQTDIDIHRNGVNYMDINVFQDANFNKNQTLTKVAKPDSTIEFEYTPSNIYSSLYYSTAIGIPENDFVHNSFNFKYGVNVDFQLGKSPFTMGMDWGLEYDQVNYHTNNFENVDIKHDHQKLNYLSFSAAYVIGIYIKEKKFIDFGVQYNLPLYTRIKQANGNQSMLTKKVHHYSDLRFKAKIGYSHGFIYADYRPLTFLKDAFPDSPKLNVGIMFNIPINE